MTVNYTTLLGLAKPVTGTESGTWGDTVNNNLTDYVDAAVAGTQIISGSLTAVTLSKTTGASLSQAGSGATGSTQYQIIRCTGNPASLLTVTISSGAEKPFIVINATSTSQSVKIIGASGTGVTITAGSQALVAWNGTDFVNITPAGASGTVTSVAMTVPSFLSVSGSPITSSGTLAVSLSGTALPVANGGTGSTTGDLSSCTADGTNAVGFKNIPKSGSDKTTSYTLATTDVGKYIGVGTSGSIVVPDATFSAGDAVSIFNNTSGNITLTMTITTAYISGTDADKATITLATRGIANILFLSGTVCVVSGNVS